MACRLPGADGLDAFWKLVVGRGTGWGPLPESRLPRNLYFHPEKGRVGRSYSELGGIVSDRPVDPTACPITSDLAARHDVAHHIFLEVAALAARDAGLDPFAMPRDRRTGVYVGHTGGSTRTGDIIYATGIDEAASLLAETAPARELLGDEVGDVATEVVDAVRRRYPGRRPGERLDLGPLGAAQIVHEALRLDGPFLVVDAACASSLQALAIAARALAQGSIDQAIVGGASYCKSDSLVLFSAAQSVSGKGSCPFGEAADGLVTAEGYVAIVIKRLSRAIADGDRIRAVIRGLGVASDGKGKSLWAPRQEGQALAVERAYPDPADLGRIEYIEAHATSTQVGDATELAALAGCLAPHVQPGRRIPIGSVKANIGHTLETAGIAGLVKVVLALEHGVIPPGSTCDELTSEFDWRHGPFTVPREPLDWPAHRDGSPRQAAVNAFGIGGLNVHVAVSEHVPSAGGRPFRPRVTDDGGIAIVGAGCVLPGALSLDAFFARIDRGESAISRVPAGRWHAARALDQSAPRTWHTTSDRGGFVRDFAYDWRRHKVPPKQVAAANPLQFMLLEAADAAIEDAGGPRAGLDRARTGVVVGALFGGDFGNELQMGLRLPETAWELTNALSRRGVSRDDIDRIVEAYERTLLARMPALLDETGSFTSSTLASRLTKSFDLMGGAVAIDSGDCSSVSALSAAADMLRQGDCDAVICAAGQRSLDLTAFEGLSLLGKLRGEADAWAPGEGAVVFVLKRLTDARAAGDRIRGIIHDVEVRSVAAERPSPTPALARLFGHTGAAAAAVELLALTGSRASGDVAISQGPLVGRIECGEATGPGAVSTRPEASPALARRPLVAALFPGQGSQYTDMFRGLVAESEVARDALARLDSTARALGHETLAELAWRPDNGLGTRIWDTQWAIYLGDLLAWDVLQSMGFSPDVVASHSFGEFPALAATAAWTIDDGARATRARADAVERHGPPDGAMLSVIADRGTVQAAIDPRAGTVWLCAENAPEQFVIGGTARAVDAVESSLEARRVRSKRLAVPSPFHTPLLERSAEDLAATIESLPIGTPAIPTYSSTTVATMADPAAVRESLARQMTETVRWIGVVERLYAAGVRTFVEVGPSGVLTGLARRILDGREDCTFLQFDQRGRPADEHLARLRETLGQAGALRAHESPARSRGPLVVGGANPRATRGTVVSFDATARRRNRNRAGARQFAAERETAATASRAPARRDVVAAGVGRDGGSSGGGGRIDGDGHAGGPGMEAEIETFLVEFVVEQTGYPREIVELDADLEAELGIDSIRKAQLFGAIGEEYGLKADDGISFDEFPTLRRLLEHVLQRVAGDTAVVPARHVASRATWQPPPGQASPAEASTAHDPTASPGGFDALLVAPADAAAPRGLVVCFGRHARPAVRRVESHGLGATLVGARHEPGAVAGWNDAGLIVLAASTAGRDAAAVMAVVAEVATSCRSIAEARRLIDGRGMAARNVACADVNGTDEQGFSRCSPRSPLARVALADGTVTGTSALAALLDGTDAETREALSTTCAWVACGVSESGAIAVSGGPFAGRWLGDDAVVAGAAWRAAAKSRRGTARDQAGADGITRRYALATRELEPPTVVRSLAGERVLILGDGDLAESLARAVEGRGGIAVAGGQGSTAEACAAVERAAESGPVRHMIVAAARRRGDVPWTLRSDAAIHAPFFACQRWIATRATEGDMASATLTAVVDLGGDFGISGSIGGVEGGAIAGLFKGVAREFPALHVKVVDAPQAFTPLRLAEAVVNEMLDAAGPVEVGLTQVGRVTVVPWERPPRQDVPLRSLTRGSVWIVTGGARGVTAECARELARRHGVALALVGSTRPVALDQAWLELDETGLGKLKGRVMVEARGRGDDPRNAWRAVEKSIEIEKSLARFRAAGVDARYVACDLADATAVRTLVERVAREMGAVRGVLHGAGFESACRFEKKTREGLAATLGPKCFGIEHLLAAIDPATLEAVVGFGSISGRRGGHGQADYALANDMLAKILADRRRSGLRATVFHWHAWDGVGMATRPESRFMLEQFGLAFMPLAEGVRRFMDELEAGLPDAEVMVTEPACAPNALVTGADSERGSLVDDVKAGAGCTDVTFRLDPTTDRFLLDHLQFGRPLLPAALGVELLAQAAIASGACGRVLEIRDFSVERPITFPNEQSRRVRVEVADTGAGSARARGWIAAVVSGGQPATEERIAIRGVVSSEASAPIPARMTEPPLPFNPMIYADDAPLWHGDSFRTLTGLFLDRSGGWGRLVAPEADVVAAPRGAGGWTVPVALLDGCLVACGVYSYILCGQRVEVPVRFERLGIAEQARAGETCVVRLLFRGNDVRESVYDLELHGDDGRGLLAIEGLHLAVLSGERGRT